MGTEPSFEILDGSGPGFGRAFLGVFGCGVGIVGPVKISGLEKCVIGTVLKVLV